jgi:excisionase family DNA binding protein
VRTRFRVPPVSPSSGAVTSGVVRRHLDPVELPEVLLVSEVAELLRVHPSTVYALCDRGELPHLKVSGCIRSHRAGVEDFVRAAGEQASERDS